MVRFTTPRKKQNKMSATQEIPVPTGLDQLPVEKRMEELQKFWEALNLRPLKGLGDPSKGQPEIIGVNGYVTNPRYFTDINYSVRWPSGAVAPYVMRHNANGNKSDGAVFVPVLISKRGLKLVFVRQFKLPFGDYTVEVPRGFSEAVDSAAQSKTLDELTVEGACSKGPLNTLLRELGEEVINPKAVLSVTVLGNSGENSTTHNVFPTIFLVRLDVDESKLKSKVSDLGDKLTLALMSPNQARSELGHRIDDYHSIVAVSLALPALLD